MPEDIILLVDDEPKVLASLSRELNELNICRAISAQSGFEGLEILKNTPNIKVIVSDYHMPKMDGIAFLSEAQKIAPDATRVILTGAAGLDMAINAVNLGQIFRFLVKPCPPAVFIPVVKASLRQYELITTERELLQKTLNGSIKILIDMLSALNAHTFAQANRLRDLARKLAVEMKMDNLWEVELAALLCQVGSVTVPPEILERWTLGYSLKEREIAMIQAIPRVSQCFVQNIPRLENIALSIGCQDLIYSNPEKLPGELDGEQIPMISRILKVVLDFDRLLEMSTDSQAAEDELAKHASDYDPKVLAIFFKQVLKPIPNYSESNPIRVPLALKRFGCRKTRKPNEDIPNGRKIKVGDLELGMVIRRDVMDHRGRLIVSKGTTVTELLRSRMENYYWSRYIDEIIIVDEKKAEQDPSPQ